MTIGKAKAFKNSFLYERKAVRSVDAIFFRCVLLVSNASLVFLLLVFFIKATEAALEHRVFYARILVSSASRVFLLLLFFTKEKKRRACEMQALLGKRNFFARQHPFARSAESCGRYRRSGR